MACALKVRQDHDRHEVANLQTWPGWVPPAIDREHARCRRLWQATLGDLADQAALLEHSDHVLLGLLRRSHRSFNLFLSVQFPRVDCLVPTGRCMAACPHAETSCVCLRLSGITQAQAIVCHSGALAQGGTT